MARGKHEKAALEILKQQVPCTAVLEHAGFLLDVKQSTRNAMKFRRDSSIIIVIHQGRGWFDPLSDEKGDVFGLVEYLEGSNFIAAMEQVAGLVGFLPAEPVWPGPRQEREPKRSPQERWQARRKPWPGSATWRYLIEGRRLPKQIVCAAIAAGMLREGPQASMWAGHSDANGTVTGWEERGPGWRGFASRGTKVLFRIGRPDALRLCVTEAAIDAMSLAALEKMRSDTLYLSTGGGWSPRTDQAIRDLALRSRSHLIAATDNNTQGELYACRLLAIAQEEGCSAHRLRPRTDDWNADLRSWRQANTLPS